MKDMRGRAACDLPSRSVADDRPRRRRNPGGGRTGRSLCFAVNFQPTG